MATVAELLTDLFASQEMKLTQLEESLADKIAALDSVGYTELGEAFSKTEQGLEMNTIQTVSKHLREMAASNPLHIRGAQLRFSYVFGEGLEFQSLKPAAQKVLDDPYNREALFSVAAYETLNLASFCEGNVIAIYNEVEKQFTLMPVWEVSGVVTDPNDDAKIRYIKRSRNGEETWIPLARWKKRRAGKLPEKLENVPVSKTERLYVKRSRPQTGWTWGVPDSLGAAVYAMAYTKYLQDNSKLVAALSMIAWNLTKTTTGGVNNAAAQVVTGGIGGTAVNTTGNAISSVGVPSAQVNMSNGQPLAAMVATSFGVPVIALLSSPGATGGSYGAATTLDGPTSKGMKAIQDSWRLFYEEILHDLGSPDAAVGFPSIDTDPAYRAAQSITTAVEFGLVHRDEGRAGILKVLSVPRLHEELPPKPEKTVQTAAQGVTGAVPGGTDQGDSNHDGDEDA